MIKVRGGLFSITDINHTHPLNWEYGRQVFSEYLKPGADFAVAMKAIGEAVLAEFKEYVKEGKNKPGRDLDSETTHARTKQGWSSHDGFLSSTNKMVDGFSSVLLMGNNLNLGGVAGFAIMARNDISSHTRGSVMFNMGLLNILTNTGLTLYADDLEEGALKRMMAWRDRNFSGTADYTQRVREKRLAKREGRTIERRPVLFIPPRTLFDDELMGRLNTVALGAMDEWFTQSAMIASSLLGEERLDAGSRTRFRARRSLIDPTKKRYAPWIKVKS